MLSGGTQRHVLHHYQREEMKILNISFSQVEIESITCRVYSHTLVRHDLPQHITMKSVLFETGIDSLQRTLQFQPCNNCAYMS